MTYLQIYLLLVALFLFILAICWSKKSGIDVLCKVILFILSISGVLFFLESIGYLIKNNLK